MVGLLPPAEGLEPLDRLIDVDRLLGSLVNLCQRDEDGIYQQLISLTEDLYALGRRLSDEISRRYFTHAQVSRSLVA
jgi:hypothetical protein